MCFILVVVCTYCEINYKLQKNSLSQRIINDLNKRDTNVLDCSLVLNFEVKSDKYLGSGLYTVSVLNAFFPQLPLQFNSVFFYRNILYYCHVGGVT